MRIVCLSAEAADICAQIGAWDDIVAVSAFAPQSGLARRTVIGGFSTADCDRIVGLAPDLIITFSDVQAEFAAQLIRAGCTVLATNQRTLAEVAQTIRIIGGTLGRSAAAETLATTFLHDIEALTTDASPRPRVYFEEWPEPMISAIGWVGELIERGGGDDVFAARRGKASRERVVAAEEVIAANPDVIVASWCGKPVDLASIRQRPCFGEISAVRHGELHAVDSDILLQPGPRLLCGARELRRIFDKWRAQRAAALAT